MQIENLKEIKKLVDQGFTFLVNHSGGKDSQAMLIKMAEVVPRQQLFVIHADLGRFEWCEETTGTVSSQEWARTQADELGIPFSVVRAKKDLFDYIRHYKRFPDSLARFCTSSQKTEPIEKWIKEMGFTKLVNCLGIRGEESANRRKGLNKECYKLDGKAVSLEPNKRLSKHDKKIYQYLPLLNATEKEVKATIYNNGQRLHPAYEEFGMSRLSCVLCVLASKGDLIKGRKAAPKLYDEFAQLEKDIGKTIFVRVTQKNKVKTYNKIGIHDYLDRPYKPRKNKKVYQPIETTARIEV